MPIRIPDSLPATATLESENIFVMTEYRALHQDIRPLNLLILNLMPTKIVTETQFLRKHPASDPGGAFTDRQLSIYAYRRQPSGFLLYDLRPDQG